MNIVAWSTPGLHAGVPTGDSTDANMPAPGGGFSQQQEWRTAVDIIQSMRLSRMRIVLITVVLAVAGLLVSASQIAPAGAATAAASGGGAKPAIVLEHGAWADGSSWDRVIRLLQADGYTVYAPPNPLRGLAY